MCRSGYWRWSRYWRGYWSRCGNSGNVGRRCSGTAKAVVMGISAGQGKSADIHGNSRSRSALRELCCRATCIDIDRITCLDAGQRSIRCERSNGITIFDLVRSGHTANRQRLGKNRSTEARRHCQLIVRSQARAIGENDARHRNSLVVAGVAICEIGRLCGECQGLSADQAGQRASRHRRTGGCIISLVIRSHTSDRQSFPGDRCGGAGLVGDRVVA